MKRLLILAAIPLALTACGGGDSGPPSASEVRDQLGCVSFWSSSSQELYVANKYDCVYGSHETAVYMFNDNDARNAWRKTAEHFGTVVLNEGDGWLEVKR